jgi:hypothetical protein
MCGEEMKIIEDDSTCEVIIDDVRIEGFIFDERHCSTCNNFWIYYKNMMLFFVLIVING